MTHVSVFTVTYHPRVRSDFRKVDIKHISVIRNAIDEKLASKPEKYGKPLRQTLKHFRSLRVGKYCIVYAVREKSLVVLVLIIWKRDSVYDEVRRRL